MFAVNDVSIAKLGVGAGVSAFHRTVEQYTVNIREWRYAVFCVAVA